MILLSELSRRRIRSIQKLIRVGRNEVVVVLRVDKEKGKFNYFPLLFPPLIRVSEHDEWWERNWPEAAYSGEDTCRVYLSL